MKKLIFIILLFLNTAALANLSLMSSAFTNNGKFSAKYACKGAVSPPLNWQGVPKGTKSFVLLVSDNEIPDKSAIKDPNQIFTADFPRITGYHWLLIDIPATMTALPQKAGTPIAGRTRYGIQGINYFSRIGGADIGGYTPPCPPVNDKVTHHYLFQLYALDKSSLGLSADGNFTADDIATAMKGHVLAQTQLIGIAKVNS